MGVAVTVGVAVAVSVGVVAAVDVAEGIAEGGALGVAVGSGVGVGAVLHPASANSRNTKTSLVTNLQFILSLLVAKTKRACSTAAAPLSEDRKPSSG
jgi:ABC-type cobalamin transport system permease subunit